MRHFHCPVNGWDCPCYVEETLIDGKKGKVRLWDDF